MVYFASVDNNTVHARDAKTGAKGWEFDVSPNSGPTAPAVDGGVVYFGASKTMYALKQASGAIAWKSALPGTACAAPVVSQGVIYIVADNLVAINANTGAVLWKSTQSSGTPTKPAVYSGMVYLMSEAQLYCFKADSGKLLWSAAVSNEWASPVAAAGLVFSGNSQSEPFAAFDAATGKKKWEFLLPDNYNPLAPAVLADRVFVAGAGSTITALNITTGKQLWSTSGLCDSHVWSEPAAVDGKLYVGSTCGTLYVFDVATGKQLWTYEAGSAVRSPVVSDGVVYFGTNSPWGPGSSDGICAVAV
eukprot:TRINITY_DN8408_c0_g1_i2.p1 TRINITY_DN8408_c0_g1~~TRINITY_DN8408_c0_g1_i2.p1  ORF type:complete len:304 (+),score=59.58 TRINITY_DN8408_c0_g1_i2:142-1053(+)